MPSGPILITGFEPFAKMSQNPSADLVRALADGCRDEVSAGELVAAVLPVEYRKSQQQIEALLHQHAPAAWIGFGLHQLSTEIRLETVAVNLDDTSLADNDGEVRHGTTINPAGPVSYQTTLPLDAISTELAKLGIAHARSDSAGRFVCNHVFYHALDVIAASHRTLFAGFIHIPWPSDWLPPPRVSHNVTLMMQIMAARACLSVIWPRFRV